MEVDKEGTYATAEKKEEEKPDDGKDGSHEDATKD